MAAQVPSPRPHPQPCLLLSQHRRRLVLLPHALAQLAEAAQQVARVARVLLGLHGGGDAGVGACGAAGSKALGGVACSALGSSSLPVSVPLLPRLVSTPHEQAS